MDNSKTPDLLSNALKFGIRLGLDRMQKLMDLLGNPQDNLKVVHVAGTNGKGSVCTYISSILANSNLKVGIFTSPYLERFSERMRIIDGKAGLRSFVEDDSTGEIDGETLERLLKLVESAAGTMVSEGYEDPTEFELVTALCFLWFAEQKVDVAVLEVGLGGRLDSTNVITKPLVTVVTAIGLDHTDRLGDTVALITGEKAGIFKPDTQAIVFDPDNMILPEDDKVSSREVFNSRAEELDIPLLYTRVDDFTSEYTPDGKMVFSVPEYDIENFSTTLMGEHQIYNCVLAVTAARYLNNFFDISEADIKEGVSLSRWKCRVESLSMDPIVLLDGGHNPQGIKSLSDSLTKIYAGRLVNQKMRLLIGVMADKDVSHMISTLEESGISFVSVYTTTVANPRSMSGSELGNRIKLVYNNLIDVLCFDDAKTAAREALTKTMDDGLPLLVTGSLYLLGEVRGELKSVLKE
ncbi:MAG: bifunctional folylpolyglutamate synthase/dihydrofolate synthase [Clostridia bacterium]|nr:bifunctional folylpolyglutamate synthase/dihydrofolate synthase [Clostridia bacterium]